MDGRGRARRRRRDALAGLTLGAVLGDEASVPRAQVSRTLLDIIREEEPNSRAYKNLVDHHHNKKSWKSFKDRIRLKKAGAVWTSSVPASDVTFHSNVVSTTTITSSPTVTATVTGSDGNRGAPMLAQLGRHNSVRVTEPDELLHEDRQCSDVPAVETGHVHLLNRSLSRVVSLQTDLSQEDSLHIEQVPVSDVPIMNSRSSMLRRNSSRIPSTGHSDEPVRGLRLSEALAAEREQIQRVVSSTEAAGRARAREEAEEQDAELENDDEEREEGRGQQQQQEEVRMSLMDLLGGTDGQIGWSAYSSDDEDDGEEDEEGEGSNLVEHNCCVCMVRHKGSAFIPCGHTFCRLCSRELWASRGNCPLCNGFILEILDIF